MAGQKEAINMKMRLAREGSGDTGSRSGGPYGPGGIEAALSRNPNDPDRLNAALNDAPYGPMPHSLGETGDGGWQEFGGGAYEGGSVPAGKPKIKDFHWK